LAANALRAWRDEYLNADGSLTQPTQANYVRALSFNMVPDELVPSTAGLLAAAIAANDYRLDTGFLATPMLLPVLAENGFLDLAYRVLLQEQEPSWLAMRNRGATTMWERWNGVDSDGVPHESLNHYSKGAVVSFLHQYTAGLKPIEPGYRRFSVAPMPNAALDWIELSLNSAAGLIEVAWKRVERQFTLEVVVPAGAEAVIQLPNGDSAAVTEGAHTFSCSL
jgi:alpha-L-rhamnosidase